MNTYYVLVLPLVAKLKIAIFPYFLVCIRKICLVFFSDAMALHLFVIIIE